MPYFTILLRSLQRFFSSRPVTACCAGSRSIHWANFR